MKSVNKILSVFLAVLMMFSIIPMANIEAEATDTTLAEMRTRAEAIVNYTWTPSRNISTWNGNKYNGKTYFAKGETVKGVPYTLFTSEVVSRSLRSLSEYKAVASSNYSATAYCVSVNDTRTGPVYGSCCADLICEVFGGNFMSGSTMRYHTVSGIRSSSYGITTYNVKAKNIVAGDALSYVDHIIWVGDVTDTHFVIYEQTPPVARKTKISKSSVDANGYLIYDGHVYSTVTKNKGFVGEGAETHKVDSSYGKNFTAYPKAKITASNIFDAYHNQISTTAWIGTSDKCTIHEVYTDGCCKLSYPLDDGGTKTVYSKISLFKLRNTLSIKYDANGGKIDASNEKYYLNSSDVVYRSSTGKVFAQEMVDGQTYESGLYNYTTFGISRKGYTFKGWGTKASGGTIYSQSESMTAKKLCSTIGDGDKTITLYAIWAPNELYVHYNANGGKVSLDEFTLSSGLIYKNNQKFAQTWQYNVAKDNGLINPKSFGLAKTGYTFTGWGTKSSGGTIFDQNDTGLLPTEINSNLKNSNCSTTLYAIWKANTYTVKYNANGGTGTISNSSHTYDTAKVLNANKFTRTGYTFLGWSTSSTATVAKYTDKQSVKNLTSSNGGTVTLYAVWSKNEHTPGMWTVVTPATCTKTGLTTLRCTTCGELLGEKELPMTEHTASAWKVVTEATCTTEGIRQKSCTVCNGIIYKEEIPATGHTAGAWETVTEATCTTEGFKNQKCTVCKEIINSEEIPTTDHILGDWVTAVEPTCETKGLKVQDCIHCGNELANEEIPATGHTAGAWETVTESGCISSGSKVQKCTICEKVLAVEGTSSVGHKASEWIVVTEATCTTVGERQKICTVCNEILETENIPVTPHIAGEWETVTNASCNEKGMKAQSCTACGTVLATEEIAVTEHVKGDWEIVTQPTCTLTGLNVQHCIECGETIATEEISTTNHIEGAWKVAIHSTCSNVGFKIKQCTECGEVLKTEEIPAKEHTFGNGLCIICGETDPSYVPDIPEEFVFYIQEPSRIEIRNKDGIVLHTVVEGELPDGARIEWSWDNNKFDVEKNDDGTLTIIARNNGETTITATVYGADGDILATDSVVMNSKSGFFDKIGGFFRSLFGATTIYEN